MQATPRRSGFVLITFGLTMILLVTLALAGTTWAAPNAQGTVPTPPAGATVAPTGTSGGGNNGGDNSGNDSNNGGDLNSGSSGDANNAQPTAPSPGAGTVCAIGENGAQCTSGELLIMVASGAASAGSALTIEGSFTQPPCPASPNAHNFMNRCYRYAWIGTNAEPLTSIGAPVQYCISYGANELAAVKNKAEAFVIGVAGADGNWTLLKPTVDPTGNRACATSNQMVVWNALFAPQNVSDLLPTVGGQPNSMLWAVALAGIALIGLGVFQVRRQTK